MAAMAAPAAPVRPRRLRTRGTGAMTDAAADGMRPRPVHRPRPMLNARLDTRAMLADRVAAVHGAPMDRLPMVRGLAGVAAGVLALHRASAIMLRLRAMPPLHVGAALMALLPDRTAVLGARCAV
ncbi:MAG TPA: hypothetical protein VFL51_01855 [Pseudolabrys sp.]|nr:hypothetical protein [Pseudolabrys sp.]